MGTYNLIAKTIKINEKTKFIIENYRQALIENKLIIYHEASSTQPMVCEIVQGSCFDARLLPSFPKTGAGIRKAATHKLEKVVGSSLGAQYVQLSPMEILVDNKMDALYEAYVTSWTEQLKKIKISEKRIVDDETAQNFILISDLLKRYVAFLMADSNLQNTMDHSVYFSAIRSFIKRITTSEHSSLKKKDIYNSIGIYLLDEHEKYISSFLSIVQCRKELESHKNSITAAHTFVSEVRKIIYRQIIAYWDLEVESPQMADDCYLNTLKEIEATLHEKASSSKVLATEKIDVQSLTRRNAILDYVKLKHDRSPNDKRYKFAQQLRSLYQILEQVEDLKELIESVGSFINGTGWMGLLGGILNLSSLGNHLNEFISRNNELLDISRHSLPEQSRAYNVLLSHGAANLTAMRERVVSISEKLYKLDNNELHELVKQEIIKDSEAICRKQRKLNLAVPIIDEKKLGIFTQRMNESEQEKEHNARTFTENHTQASSSGQNSRKNEQASEENTYHTSGGSHTTGLGREDIPMTELAQNPAPINEIYTLFKDACDALRKEDYQKLEENITASFSFYPTSLEMDNKVKFKYCLEQFKNATGETLLYVAVKGKLEKQIKWLSERGASALSVNTMTRQMPLTLAATFILTENKNIFFYLCKRAQIETAPQPDAVKEYKSLYMLSEKVVTILHQGFTTYNNIQMARLNSRWFEALRVLASLLNQDFTEQRAIEVADAYKYLLDIKDHQNYALLVEQLQLKLNSNKQRSAGSVLHTVIREALKTCTEIMERDEKQFNEETDTYRRKYPGFFESTSSAQIAALQNQMSQMAQETKAREERTAQETKAREERTAQETKAREEASNAKFATLEAHLAALYKILGKRNDDAPGPSGPSF